MTIIHTADWHLGRRLEGSERHDEHVLFLNWLTKETERLQAHAIIIAGDVFDTGNPSNTALKLYYDFLKQIKNTSCQNVVIIGGNHDSASMLDAPRHMLGILDIHVVGAMPENIDDIIIPIKNNAGETKLVICAIPFLRDKDLRLSYTGETVSEQEKRIKQGIIDIYTDAAKKVKPYKDMGIPIVATGHLFTAGSKISSDEREIHVGNLGKVDASLFPPEFDYVALGHLHQYQSAHNSQRITYSGSPIPMNFAESEHTKYILSVNINKQATTINPVGVPVFRQLVRIDGNLNDFAEITSQINKTPQQLPAWVEVKVETGIFDHDLQLRLEKIVENNKNVSQLFVRQTKIRDTNTVEYQEESSLSDLTPTLVFQNKCIAGLPQDETEELMQTFKEALDLFEQRNKA